MAFFICIITLSRMHTVLLASSDVVDGAHKDQGLRKGVSLLSYNHEKFLYN